ncbi:hypothetical protein E3J79_01205 [Candidatus Dependentiae bacterium]|nr:MAG: hypothetical protein E3J79_01205 [Candidatus Dependentiae bacterium]
MQIKKIFFLFSLFLLTINTYKITSTPSLLLFILTNNRITIERHALNKLNQHQYLPAPLREGNTLFTLDFDEHNETIESLLFNPKNSGELLILARHNGQLISYLLSWAPLITENPKMLTNLETVHFSLEHSSLEQRTLLYVPIEIEQEKTTLKLSIDQHIQAACGTFIEDNHFSYDRGLFTRTLTKKQISELGLLYTPDTKPKTKTISYTYAQQLSQHSFAWLYSNLIINVATLKTWLRKRKTYIVTKCNKLKSSFLQSKKDKKSVSQLQLDAEDEFDKLLEQSLNDNLDFITGNKIKNSSALITWFEGIGTTLLMRYIVCEQKILKWWRWLANTNPTDKQTKNNIKKEYGKK